MNEPIEVVEFYNQKKVIEKLRELLKPFRESKNPNTKIITKMVAVEGGLHAELKRGESKMLMGDTEVDKG